MLIVDRIEGRYILCEDENRKIVSIDKELMPSNIKEGDMVVKDGIRYVIDINGTEARSNNIKEKTRQIWK